MSKVTFDVEVDSGNSSKTLKGLRDELTSINEELEQVEVGSKAFNDLSKQAAKASGEIKDIEKSFEGLDATQRTEAFAKGFEGIAGAVAVTAGSLQLFGVESERIGQIEEKVQGAIAIAIGARGVSEGLLAARIIARTVAEKASSVATKALTVAQRIYNAVLNANPIFLLVTVIAAVVTGIYALSKALKTNTKDVEDNTDALLAQNEAYAKGQEFSLRLAKARGESAIELKKREIELADTLIEQAKLRKDAAKTEEEIEKGRQELSDAIANRILLRTELTKLESDEREKIAKEEEDRRKKQLEQRQKDREKEYEEFKTFYRNVLKVRNDIIKENAEFLGETLTKQITEANDKIMKDFDSRIKLTGEMARRAQEDQTKQSISNLQAYAELASYATQQFVESNAFQTTKELASTANSFISDLQGGLDESNEEGFEKAKKYKIAQVVTTGTQAAFEAFAGAQKYNAVLPGLGTAIGIALVSAIAVKSKKSIADIRSAQFGGAGSCPSAGGSGGGGSTIPLSGGGFTPIGQQAANTQLTPDFGVPSTPVRAYVIGQDVEDGREAEARLNRRRTLGPG
jgi:hypothetical protein